MLPKIIYNVFQCPLYEFLKMQNAHKWMIEKRSIFEVIYNGVTNALNKIV